MSLKEQILAAADRPLIAVDVPEWKTRVYLRGLTGRERDQVVSRAMDRDADRSDRSLSITLVGMSLCDEKGERVFQEADYPKLAEKSGAVIDRLFGRAMELNGLGEKAQAALEGN